ncbi:unnamed protein product [Coregonus sp. 'balchen']|nr:unnamed protein product [Coregonus sp. 'balchen']
MNYTRDLDEAYDEAWEEEMEDRRPSVTSNHIKSNITKAITAKHITYVTTTTNMTDGMGQGEPHVCEDRAAKQIKV